MSDWIYEKKPVDVEELENKLDKAVEALEEIAQCTEYPTCDMAQEALSKIGGDCDE